MTCQFCGEDGHDDNSYMLRPELWERVIGKPYYYSSGWACLGCVAERLYPYQLRNSDFTDGPCSEEDPERRHNPRIQSTPEWGEVHYWIDFPEDGGREVRVCIEHYHHNTSDDDKLLALEDASVGWLLPYCEAHKLRLVVEGDVMYDPDEGG